MPELAKRFTLIVPDLPGIGDSDIPANGMDMKTAAIRIHSLARSLGVTKASVVGHDIGLMVAYAYAAQFPSETTKLVEMDAFLPGSATGETSTTTPTSGTFVFMDGARSCWSKDVSGTTSTTIGTSSRRTAPTPFLAGSQRVCRGLLQTGSDARRLGILRVIPTDCEGLRPASEDSTDHAHSRPGRRALQWGRVGQQIKLVGTNVTVVVLRNTGHWLLDENPRETMEACFDFSEASYSPTPAARAVKNCSARERLNTPRLLERKATSVDGRGE